MGSGGKKKEQSGDVTIEGAPDAAEGPSYEEKLRYTFLILVGQIVLLRSDLKNLHSPDLCL